MKEPKFRTGQRARVTAGEFKGQEGVVYLVYPISRRYLVEIEHQGFLENHYHHIRVAERDMEASE